MSKAYIVTDIGYGDCGKGTIVDFLARQYKSSLVIRHNGGSQAAHNVVTPQGVHHTFSQFGSASLTENSKTYLSRFMLVNPLNMINEANHLISIGVKDIWKTMFIDKDSLVITPWHVYANRIREVLRNNNRHGSCGEGIGETRCDYLQVPQMSLRIRDLMNDRLGDKLRTICDYKFGQMKVLENEYGVALDGLYSDMFTDDNYIIDLIHEYQYFVSQLNVVDIDFLSKQSELAEVIIFEGAQGALLDEWYGFHPYTTWSTTTGANAKQLLSEIGYNETVEHVGVMRSYTTRHGDGPFVSEDKNLEATLRELHNEYHPFQGAFRCGYLDMIAHKYAIDVCGDIDSLAVTHLDYLSKNSAWKICDKYYFDSTKLSQHLFYEHDGLVSGIRVSDNRDLVRQNMLSDSLRFAVPSLTEINRQCDAEILCEYIESMFMKKVFIKSFGPMSSQKEISKSVFPN
ncbi:MAG: adenylosuccinate synthetase [Acidimicrobiia bacterium]